MENLAIYQLFKNIDIELFERTYQDMLGKVVKGDSSVALNRYKGLLPACDAAFANETEEQWKPYYLYVGLMQPVLMKVVEGKEQEQAVSAFMQAVSPNHIKELFELLEADLNMQEDSRDISDFENYCECIMDLPILHYAFSYAERKDFLHKDVELNPKGFLGNILMSIHALNCLVDKKKWPAAGTVELQDIRMYGNVFEKQEPIGQQEAFRKQDEFPAGEELGTVIGLGGNSGQSEKEVIRRLEAEQRDLEQQLAYSNAKSGGRLKRIAGTLSALVTKIFGKKVVPFFWIALVILYVGNVLIAIPATIILYLIGKIVS